MTSTVTPIRKHSMYEERDVMRKLLKMGHSMLAFAKTPDQLARMQERYKKMEAKLASFEKRIERLEQGG